MDDSTLCNHAFCMADSTNKETFKEQEKKWKDMGIGSFR